jgi:hypothetical protein
MILSSLFLAAIPDAGISNIILLVISSLFGGGFLAAVIKFAKMRPEIGQVLVTSAEGVVVIQEKLIDNLQEEIDRQAKIIVELRKELDALYTKTREQDKALRDMLEKFDTVQKEMGIRQDRMRDELTHMKDEHSK